MDLRTQTSLLAAVLCLAIGGSVLFHPRKRRIHWAFIVFDGAVAAWYSSTFLLRYLDPAPLWLRLNLTCAVLLPAAAVQFFNGFVAVETRHARVLSRTTLAAALVMLVAIYSPFYRSHWVSAATFLYVGLPLIAALSLLYARGSSARSPFARARLRYLAVVGALAAAFTMLDYLPYVGLEIPPIGTVLVLIFLYVLAQSLLRYRLIDLYELAGRLAVLTAVSFALATNIWLLVYFAGERFFLQAVVAAMVVLLTLDPLRSKVEEQIAQLFFSERHAFERSIIELKRRLAHVLELDDMTQLLLHGLEQSRRVTHAAIYLVDEDIHGYALAGHVGPEPVRRLERTAARPFLDLLQRRDAVSLEPLERELEGRRARGQERDAETLHEIIQAMEAMHASVCIALRGEGELYGMLCLRDERLRDAFSPEEVQLLVGLAVQAAVAFQNSRLYRHLRERDRLAALGELAAGLAHEIRNPLGAIKASAQYLAESQRDVGPAAHPDPNGPHEFLDIIVDEVDRLNRVVSSILDYARPQSGNPAPVDVNAAIRRTLQLLETDRAPHVELHMALAGDLPAVRIDVEQLRQVLMNLIRNAVEAMDADGSVTIETTTSAREAVDGSSRYWVELRVSDTGPGIPPRVLSTLFVPFVTTKERGTGLGLAISQRIIHAAGGRIEARSQAGMGTTFLIRLPAASGLGAALPSPRPEVNPTGSDPTPAWAHRADSEASGDASATPLDEVAPPERWASRVSRGS